jgi:hypothetical protein
MSGDTTHYCPECVRLALRLADAEIALHLIAAPMRPDGSWNRDRKACQLIAHEFLYPPAPGGAGSVTKPETDGSTRVPDLLPPTPPCGVPGCCKGDER